jgi:hypothetical protein
MQLPDEPRNILLTRIAPLESIVLQFPQLAPSNPFATPQSRSLLLSLNTYTRSGGALLPAYCRYREKRGKHGYSWNARLDHGACVAGWAKSHSTVDGGAAHGALSASKVKVADAQLFSETRALGEGPSADRSPKGVPARTNPRAGPGKARGNRYVSHLPAFQPSARDAAALATHR